jgi:hypothetical protein
VGRATDPNLPPVILVFNELTKAEPGQQEELNSLFDYRRSVLVNGKWQKAPRDAIIAVATNTASSAYANNYGSSPALLNRFRGVYLPTVTEHDEILQITADRAKQFGFSSEDAPLIAEKLTALHEFVSKGFYEKKVRGADGDLRTRFAPRLSDLKKPPIEIGHTEEMLTTMKALTDDTYVGPEQLGAAFARAAQFRYANLAKGQDRADINAKIEELAGAQ